jgi:hypothetical protein
MVPGTQSCTKISSIFVHAADGYLHIATEAVEMTQMFPQAPVQHRHGRTLDPWCLDNRDTMGTIHNKNFWGCALSSNENKGLYFNRVDKLEATLYESFGKSIMNFTDERGTKYAVLGPTPLPSNADWQATSFALSSQCTPIPKTACNIGRTAIKPDENANFNTPFNCSVARGSPVDFSGTHKGDAHAYNFFDFHKYLVEVGSFQFSGHPLQTPFADTWSIIPDVTEQEATQMFPNTWRWTAAVDTGLGTDMLNQSSLTPSAQDDMRDILWPLLSNLIMVVACNTTGK